MLKRIFFLAMLITAIVFAGTVTAQIVAPPAHGGYNGGWGMNPTNWQTTTGSFYAWGLYDPLGGGGGAGWVVGWSPSPTYISYSPITLELWVEMYSLQTYEYTSYRWHRLGNAAETITFTIRGLIQSNNGQVVILTWDGVDPMTHLKFRGDMFGRTGAPYGYDIPITWYARWGNGSTYGSNVQSPWTLYIPDPNIELSIPSCDHWFEFEGSFDLPYHIEDGYYSLTMSGCPAPEM